MARGDSHVAAVCLGGSVMLAALAGCGVHAASPLQHPRLTNRAETGRPKGTLLEGKSTTTVALMVGGVARGPMVHPRLLEGATTRLRQAIPVALEHVRDHPSCQALFARLGADGVAKLNGTSYYPADVRLERQYCRRGSFAITSVGGSTVALCRSFGRLSDQEAATILIHEALHFAGQTEYPSDPDAPDGIGISKMVMKSCRLQGCSSSSVRHARRFRANR